MRKLVQRAAALLLIGRLFLPAQAHGFSIGEERMIGEQLLYAVRGEFDLLDDPDIAQYIDRLGSQVLESAGPQYFDYHFFVVENDQFNAFAAPSGLIFFNSGLIKTVKTEDQLASVMAHEVGHVVSRHIASRMAKQTKVTAVSMLFGLASLAMGNPALTQGLLTGSLAAGSTASLSFSREDEEQADRLAFDWMRSMKRDPGAMEEMLKVMRRIARYRSEQLPPYLLTHPNPEDRLHYVRSLLELHQKEADSIVETDNFAFLRFKYRVLSQARDPEEMRTYCVNAAAGSNQDDADMARYGLALLSAEEKDYSSAIKQMELVRRAYPDKEVLNVDLAVLQLEAGQQDQALETLRRAVLRDATDMHATFHLAKALDKQGDAAEAERLYLKAAKAMPEYSRLYYELGGLKAKQGQNGTSNFYLAKYYLYEGRIKDAKLYLQRAEKDHSVPAVLRNEAEAILRRLEELEDA